MPEISMLDLRANLTEILRRVEENGEGFTVNRFGKTVAAIVPIDPDSKAAKVEAEEE